MKPKCRDEEARDVNARFFSRPKKKGFHTWLSAHGRASKSSEHHPQLTISPISRCAWIGWTKSSPSRLPSSEWKAADSFTDISDPWKQPRKDVVRFRASLGDTGHPPLHRHHHPHLPAIPRRTRSITRQLPTQSSLARQCPRRWRCFHKTAFRRVHPVLRGQSDCQDWARRAWHHCHD